MIIIGTKCRVEQVVTEELTAQAAGSGQLPVFGTLFLYSMAENAAYACLQEFLDHTQSSIGVHLDISSDTPTPIGMKVTVEVEIYAVSENSRIVDFKVTAWDEKGVISQGTHTRAVIDNEHFLEKCHARSNAQ
jgi:predicted thioesterase